MIAPLYQTTCDPNVPRNKWGREILPRVMYSTIMDIAERYGNPLMFITENGHGAYEDPDARAWFTTTSASRYWISLSST